MEYLPRSHDSRKDHEIPRDISSPTLPKTDMSEHGVKAASEVLLFITDSDLVN